MEYRTKLSLWLIAILAATAVNASTLSRNQLKCARSCVSKDNSLQRSQSVNFEYGKTYVYDVKTTTQANTHFAFAQEESEQGVEESLIDITAKARITALNECEVRMQLREVQINFRDAQASVEDDEQIVRVVRQLETPFLFAYKNGIVSDVCLGGQHHEEEETLVQNIKKSIISALQTTPKIQSTENIKLVETDLNGECETEYNVEKQSRNKFLVIKQKDLKQCENSIINSYSGIGDSLLQKDQIESSVRCEQVIENQQIERVECLSNRQLKTVMPHYQVELISHVQLVAESVESAKQNDLASEEQYVRSPHRLMMSPHWVHQHGQHQHQQYQHQMIDGRTELKTTLDQICYDIKQNNNRVGFQTAHLARRLAQIFEQASSEDVEFVWKNIVSKHTICDSQSKKLKDIFVDTAASVMNKATARVVRDEFLERLQSSEPTSQRRTRYLATLIAFSSQPTQEAVREMVPELLEKVHDSHVVLSLSALVKKAKEEQRFVDSQLLERIYETVLEKTLRSIGESRSEAEIIRHLKSLENISPRTEVASQQRLAPITTQKRLSEMVRFAAIKSLEGIKMNHNLRQTLIGIFEDRSEANEIRIIAYRTLVNNDVTVEELKQILEIVKREQESNQDIFNYVCSHQKNLRTTEDVRKRALLPLDAPLFPEPQSVAHLLLSRNYEWSFVDPKITVGGIVEADVVMPKESRVPRLVTFNLTVPVADKQISVVELTVRQEGLERSLTQIADKLKKIAQKPSHMLREMSQIVKQQKRQIEASGEEGKIQLLLSIDGKSVFVWDSTEERHQPKQWEDIWNQLISRLPVRVDETMVMMPLKHRVPIQTASGIPVTFELNTTLIASFDSSLVGHKSAQSYFEMLLKPTLVAEFSVGLEADVYSVIQRQKPKQIQVVSRVIAAPTLHLKAETKEDQKLRLSFLLPEEEQTIVRFETEFNRQRRTISNYADLKNVVESREQANYGDEKERCLAFMERVFGFTFCYKHRSFSDLKKALAHKDASQIVYRSELKLKKTDRQMEGIQMTIQLPQSIIQRNVQEKELKFVFEFDTPNSQVQRHFASEILVRIPRHQNERFQVQLDVDSPIKKFTGQLVVIDEQNEKSIQIELLTDGNKRQFLLEAGALVDIKDATNYNLKLKGRIQPTERSEILSMEGELALATASDKKNLHVKLECQEKTIIDLTLVKSGYLRRQTDYKLSTDLKVNILGVKLQSNGIVSKNQQTGTLKTSGQIKYNRFWSRRTEQLESFEYALQYTGFNNQEREIKKFVHFNLASTQYPGVNSELTYNIKGDLEKELDQELTFKYGSQQEKQLRIAHKTRSLQNPRNRDSQKFDTQAEIEIIPAGIKYGLTSVLDITQEPLRFEFDLKVENRQTGTKDLESHFVYNRASKTPLRMEAVGEVKVQQGKYVFLYKDSVQEVRPGTFQGKTEIELPQYTNRVYKRNIPKRLQLAYTYQAREDRKDRTGNFILSLIKNCQRFEHELTVENERFGEMRHQGLFAIDRDHHIQLRSALHRQQEQIYKYEMEIVPEMKNIKVQFETINFDRLQAEAEYQLKGQIKAYIALRNQRFQHKTLANMDKREFNFELLSQTQKDSKDILVIEAKKAGEQSQIGIKSDLIAAEIELKNVPEIFRAVSQKRQVQKECHCKVEFELPKFELQHKSHIRVQPQTDLAITSETRKQGRNLFKVDAKLAEGIKTVDFEYRSGNVGSFKLTKQSEDIYQIEGVIESRNKAFSHKTSAQWQYAPRTSFTARSAFKVLNVDIKNHMSDKALFDLYYRRDEAQQFVHQLTISTRDSHLEFSSSQFNREADPKALLIVKSKKFGGVQHKTELKKVDLRQKTFQLYSNTIRGERVLLEINCDLALQKGKQSQVKIELANKHKIEARFVPFEQFEAEGSFASRWESRIKFERKNEKHWQVAMETNDRRDNQRWTFQSEHKCDSFTLIKVETPIMRGETEIRLDQQTLRVELKGLQKLRDFEHKTDAKLNLREKSLQIQSQTIKSNRALLNVDGQIYLDLYKTSTLKVESEPTSFKVAIECDPQTGIELELATRELKHKFEIKKRSTELTIKGETRTEDKTILLLDAQISPSKVQFNGESGLRRFPATLKGKIDIEDREVSLECHDKRQDRVIKLEAKARDLKNLYIECAWDARRDTDKKVVIEMRVEDRQTSGDRWVASIKGEAVARVFESKVEVDYKNLFRGQHRISGEYKNRKNQEQSIFSLAHQYQNEIYQTEFECRKNQAQIIKGTLKIDSQQKRGFTLAYVSQSDLELDPLNVHIEMTRKCERDECKQQASIKYGKSERKEIAIEAHNNQKEVVGKVVVQHPAMPGQTFKVEWNKPELKLQVNVYNAVGRQLDINVDVAKALQKKFQIVSFLDSIPTVDIEAAYGENSRVVFAISFKQEKKMELSLNWFGQWRRDFKLEALFKCFSRPGFEMLIVSRHPAGMDQIDAVVKVQNKEYNAKWSRAFEQGNKNWNTKAQFAINGQKKIDLEVERQKREEQGQRQVLLYTARMDGVYQGTGRVEFHLRQGRSQQKLEKVKIELAREQESLCNIETYYQYEEATNSPTKQTGVKVVLHHKPLFALIYAAEKEMNSQKRRASMVHLQLPGEMEYVLRNQIHYENKDQIKFVRSTLEKKGQQPIYQADIFAIEDREADMKGWRLQIKSPRFASQTAKVLEVRYNTDAKQCQTEIEQGQVYRHKKCARFEIIAGEQQQQQGVKLGFEVLKNQIDREHENRTIRFSIESLNQEDEFKAINFTATAHVSAHSVGYKWENINRFGMHKAGLVFIGLRPEDQPQMFDLIVRNEDKKQPSKSYGFDVHFSPKDIRKTMQVNAKWDQDKLRQWVVGELPRIEKFSDAHVSQLQAKMIGEVKDEISHKVAQLKENFDEELVQPIQEEAKQIQRQMESSEQEVARQVAKLSKQMARKANQLWNEIDLEQWLGEVAYEMDQSIEQFKRQVLQKLEQECDEIKACHQVVNQLRDYEIEKFIRRNVIERAQKMHEKVEQYVPRALLEAFHDLHELAEESEEEHREHQKHGHGVHHLLKMARPEIADTFVEHLGKIAQHFTAQQSQQQQGRQQEVNWPEVRGSVHDMAVDMFDSWQQKSTEEEEQQQQEQKSFWQRFGGQNQSNSPYQQKSKQYYQEKNNQVQSQPAIYNNIIFSPKRGELKLGEYTYQAPSSTGKYWTRA